MASLNLGDILVKLGLDRGAFNRETRAAARDFEKFGKNLTGIGTKLTAAVTLPLAAIGAGAIKAASDFESSFAGVRKTVDATEAEFAELADGFKTLSTEIPISVNELNKIGESAGQLGIAKEDILEFTEVMAKLGVTTNLSSEEAATSLARFSNVTAGAETDFNALGSTIVELGNNMATTEAEIVQFGLRIAGAGNVVGLSQDEILAFGATLSSLGIEAQAGGTAISKAFIAIASSVDQGGEKLEGFAQVAGMSVTGFAELFEKDAARAMQAFIGGLGTVEERGGSLFGTLDALGLSEVRLRDALLKASSASELLGESLTIAKDATEAGTAITKEAEIRFATFEKQLELAKNKIILVAIALGENLLPLILDLVDKAIVPAIEKLSDWVEAFSDLDGSTKIIILSVVGLVAAIGPMLIVFGQLAASVSAMIAIWPVLVTVWGAAGTALSALLPPLLAVAAGLALGAVVGLTIEKFLVWAGVLDSVSEKVAKLVEEMEPSPQQMQAMADASKIAGREITSWDEATKILAADLANLREANGAFGTFAKDNADLVKQATEEVTAALAGQGTVSRETFIAVANALGGTSEAVDLAQRFFGELTTQIQATDEAGTEVAGTLDGDAEAAKRAADELERLTGVAVGLSTVGLEQEMAELNKVLGLLPTGARLTSAALDEILAKIDLLNSEGVVLEGRLAEINEAFKKFGAEAIANLPKAVAPTIEWDDAMKGVNDELDEIGSKTPKIDPFSKLIPEVEAATVDWDKSLAAVANTFEILGIGADSVLGKILGGISGLGKAFTDLSKINIGGGGGGGGILGGLGGLFGGGGGGGGGGLGDALGGEAVLGGLGEAGAAGGTSFLGGLTSVIGSIGPLGAAIGPAIAVLGSVISGFIHTESERIQEDVERDFGVAISEGLAKAIEAAEAEVGGDRSAAIQLNLGDIIGEAIASGDADFDAITGQIADTFSFLERGQLTAEQAQQSLNESVAQLLPHLDELGPAGEEQLRRIIASAEEMGLEFEGLSELILSTFAPSTFEDLREQFGLSTEAVRMLAEASGIPIQTNLQRMAVEAGITAEHFGLIVDAAEAQGISMAELPAFAEALGVSIEELGPILAELGNEMLTTFAPSTVQELNEQFGLTREQIAAIEEATGVKVLTNIQKMAQEAGLTTKEFKALAAAAEENGVAVEDIDELAAAMGLTVAQLAEAWGVDVAGATKDVNAGMEEGTAEIEAGATAAERLADFLAEGARNAASIDIPNVPQGNGGAGATPMAEGALVTRPTLALIGEAGPEVVIPVADLPQGVGPEAGEEEEAPATGAGEPAVRVIQLVMDSRVIAEVVEEGTRNGGIRVHQRSLSRFGD